MHARLPPVAKDSSQFRPKLRRIDELIRGLEIVRSLDKDPLVEVDGGLIYAGVPSKTPDKEMLELERLNWLRDREHDVWFKRV